MLSFLLLACEEEGAKNAQRVIAEVHAAEVTSLVEGDIERHLEGIREAGERLARGYRVPEEQREKKLRAGLKYMLRLPKGIAALALGSPATFLAALDRNGVVIAIGADREKDRMRGVDLGKHFPLVGRALAGESGYEVDQFPGIEEGASGNVSLLFAAPVKIDGAVVGAALTGIPLSRLARRVRRQLRLDHVKEKGLVLWVYFYRGDALFEMETPPDLDKAIPDAAARQGGLAANPGGFGGGFLQFGRWYGYRMGPLAALGPGLGMLIVRSDPPTP